MNIYERFEPRDAGHRSTVSALSKYAKVSELPASNIVFEVAQEESLEKAAMDLIGRLQDIADSIGARFRYSFVSDCPSCGKTHAIDYELDDFDPAMHYCGGSERCLP